MVSIVTCGAPILPFAGRSTSNERQDGCPTSYYRDHHGHPATQGDSLHLLLYHGDPDGVRGLEGGPLHAVYQCWSSYSSPFWNGRSGWLLRCKKCKLSSWSSSPGHHWAHL